ncbi:MAG: tRNA (N6-threonylcarbamoyladenosine(37)-N6)-methyltransferase TrmO [Bacteroidales bacterium]|nr:tRNA (N6-threonylcarbamoyladenosine(37)-N6)-methyltransferase TrmO [Bacteroidales bacterium]
MEILPIAHIRTDFPEKFGIPRQSGLASSLRGKIVFEPAYRDSEALRGLEGFSHLWLIWEFSANGRSGRWQPTVRPPRLGGNRHMGVFATRSPFRPNPLGLSCVELEGVENDTPEGPVIYVRGADLMDGTPLYDIKPYIRYADSRPDALCGYVDSLQDRKLKVVLPEQMAAVLPQPQMKDALVEVLSLDPRPSYHDDPQREYGISFGGCNIRFRVNEDVLEVVSVSGQ